MPVGQTTFQKDLIEILISLHAKSLKAELILDKSLKQEESDSNEMKSTTNSYSNISYTQMTYLFDNNVRAVLNHPCLLVDHYMPRQFLLMEPNEKLISSSDKFKKLEQFLSSIVYRDRQKHPKSVNVTLISHSVRELDLLEGFIIGKKFKLKRLSGTSLYEERHVYPTDHIKSDTSNDTSDSNSASVPLYSTSNKYTGYSRDDYNYSVKRRKGIMKANDEDWLFLTTSTHLLNDPNLLSEYDVDLIISFDPILDPNLKAFSNIKVSDSKIIPLVKMVVKNSADHYLVEKNLKPDLDKEYHYIKESLLHFLQTRQHEVETTTPLDYSNILEILFDGELIIPELSNIQLADKQPISDIFEPILSPLEYSKNKLSTDQDIPDIRTYQMELMLRTVSRMNDIQNDYNQKKKMILKKRLEETNRQDIIDEIKDNIGNTFKQFQESEKDVTDSEKRLERSEAENIKLNQRLSTLKKRKDQLSGLLVLSNETEVKGISGEYKDQISSLQENFDGVKLQNEIQASQNDELRAQYQLQSSAAAELALQLNAQKEALEQLKKVVTGPTASAEIECLNAVTKQLQKNLEFVQNKKKFLNLYMEKMNSHYDLKSLAGNGSNGNRVPSGTSSNGRTITKGSRYRSTRSNSPAYT